MLTCFIEGREGSSRVDFFLLFLSGRLSEFTRTLRSESGVFSSVHPPRCVSKLRIYLWIIINQRGTFWMTNSLLFCSLFSSFYLQIPIRQCFFVFTTILNKSKPGYVSNQWKSLNLNLFKLGTLRAFYQWPSDSLTWRFTCTLLSIIFLCLSIVLGVAPLLSDFSCDFCGVWGFTLVESLNGTLKKPEKY